VSEEAQGKNDFGVRKKLPLDFLEKYDGKSTDNLLNLKRSTDWIDE